MKVDLTVAERADHRADVMAVMKAALLDLLLVGQMADLRVDRRV